MKRKHGDGCLFKRNGVYYLRYSIEGKVKAVSLKTGDKKKAEVNANDYLSDNHAIIKAKTKEELVFQVGEARNLLKRTKTIFLRDAYDVFLESKRRRQTTTSGTLLNYKRIFNRFASWTKPNHPEVLHISDVTENIAEEYSKYLSNVGIGKCLVKDRISGNTYNYHIGALKLIFSIVLSDENNPFRNINKRPEQKATHKLLSKAEVKRINEAFTDNTFTIRNKDETKALFTVGLYTGLRLVDAVLLSWENINSVIKLKPQKTRSFNKEVIIPISRKLRTVIGHGKNQSGYILPTLAERYLKNPDGLKDDIKKVFAKAEIHSSKNEIVGFHSLRHTFITECVINRMEINTLSKITGDNIRTLEKYYIHLKEDIIRKAEEELPVY